MTTALSLGSWFPAWLNCWVIFPREPVSWEIILMGEFLKWRLRGMVSWRSFCLELRIIEMLPVLFSMYS